MRLREIFEGYPHIQKIEQLSPIRLSCSNFLDESKGQPLYKVLSSSSSFSRIKVRHKSDAILENVIDRRAVVTTSTRPIQDSKNYWVFPIDGYRYLYNPTIRDYKDTIPKVTESIRNNELAAEVIRYSYLSENLGYAFTHHTEILWYKIPQFYAVDCSAFRNYDHLLRSI